MRHNGSGSFRRCKAIIKLGLMTVCLRGHAAPTHLVDEQPVRISKTESGVVVVDFGRVAFGNIRLMPPDGASGEVVVHFGEAAVDGRVNREPLGSVRYNKTTVELDDDRSIAAVPPPDKRNTGGRAILTPSEWGAVLPFRWIEIVGWNGELLPKHLVRQSAFAATWDDAAASFKCSDEMLNQIWELCRYSIKATTFAGVYVDGDRERIPYEGDAYINQLSHYYADSDKQMARDTFDHLIKYPTWPTEWPPHLVFMAYADWMHTGDKKWLAENYDRLETMLLMDRRGEDDLIASERGQERPDIVDWPPNERDGYIFTERNTVVNAFHLRTLELMRRMATALGKSTDAKNYAALYASGCEAFQKTFFNEEKGLYLDGVNTDHISVHANLFPLAFGLVPEKDRKKITDWLVDREMKCSVYAAQYLMEAFFENGAGQQAVELMTADNDRSWRHMVESGTTITWEAWDQKYKPNQDWNHAWGAAPANLLPRYVLGAEPLTPGWKAARISPRLGGLDYARGKVPTIHGPLLIDCNNEGSFILKLGLPEGMKAKVDLPMVGKMVLLNGMPVKTAEENGRLVLDDLIEGSVVLEVR